MYGIGPQFAVKPLLFIPVDHESMMLIITESGWDLFPVWKELITRGTVKRACPVEEIQHILFF